MTTSRDERLGSSGPLAKRLVVRVFWRNRRESKERCAELLASYLAQLRSISPFFQTWKSLGRSRSEARAELETSAPALARRLRQNHTDLPRRPIPSLGFHFAAWAGELDGASAKLSVNCGGYASTSSNSVVLALTCEGSWSQVSRSTVRRMFDAAIETWRPERGTAGFGLFHGLSGESSDLDWMVYLDANQQPPSLPKPAQSKRLPDGGTLITLAPKPPNLRKTKELAHVELVRRSLAAAAPA